MEATRAGVGHGGVVLDASACIAVFRDEPGADGVEPLLPVASLSSVNWAEVLQLAIQHDVPVEMFRLVSESGLTIVPFDEAQAETVAMLRAPTRRLGLSLADRACLALASTLGSPVITADRAWADLDVGVEIRLIR